AWAQLTFRAVDAVGRTQVGVHEDHHALVWTGNRLIDANDGGVWSSIDRGATWQGHTAGLPLLQIYGGAVHPTRDVILVNTQDNGVPVRQTATGGWENHNLGGEGSGVAISSTHPDTDWAYTFLWSIVWRTTDGGLSRKQVQSGLDLSNRVAESLPL